MLVTQKNQVAGWIRNAGFDLADFKYSSKVERKITHSLWRYRDSPLYFKVLDNPLNFYLFDCERTSFAPEFPIIDKAEKVFGNKNDGYDLSIIARHFFYFLEDVRLFAEEQAAQDEWVSLEEDDSPVWEHPEDFENWSPAERRALREALTDLQHHVATENEATAEQIKELQRRIEYLAKQVELLNKFNWKSVAATVFMGAARYVMNNPDKAQEWWEHLKVSVGGILRLH
ncbi:hypothetical protein DES53_102788 [Roseimicrobium gellanilyticum]|uniref:Uncharacterized protein n=1 Tax=Roseimicrobium gellanilyticum TaxID=748857 RepID=A0A366HUL0_9BACT|nr:hypothetical protein [Roseimicrobium gellanilyticum]RBP46397.1 hypothetical protein DES53_102788 [Roseimicrobium gellanilyticum]